MDRPTEHLVSQLLRLSRRDRARLAERLLASLDSETETEPEDTVESAWQAEGERRLAELKNGLVAGMPAADVFAGARRRLST